MAPATSSVWNGDSDRDLLLTIIDQGGPSSAKWQLIADEMQGKGYTFTKEACRQHFQKIRRQGRAAGSSPVRAVAVVSRARGPSDRPAPHKQKSAGDSFLSTNSSPTSLDNHYDDDDDDFTPLKRKRTVKEEDDKYARAVPLFKIEGRGDETKPIDVERDDLYNDYDDAEYA